MSKGVTAEEFFAFLRAEEYTNCGDLEVIWSHCGISDEAFSYIVDHYDDLCDMYLQTINTQYHD